MGNVKKEEKNNILSDTMAYSVHGFNGWQKKKKSEMFKGEEAIKNKQGEWARMRGEG